MELLDILLAFAVSMAIGIWYKNIIYFLVFTIFLKIFSSKILRIGKTETITLIFFSFLGWLYGRYTMGFNDIFFYECADED